MDSADGVSWFPSRRDSPETKTRQRANFLPRLASGTFVLLSAWLRCRRRSESRLPHLYRFRRDGFVPDRRLFSSNRRKCLAVRDGAPAMTIKAPPGLYTEFLDKEVAMYPASRGHRHATRGSAPCYLTTNLNILRKNLTLDAPAEPNEEPGAVHIAQNLSIDVDLARRT